MSANSDHFSSSNWKKKKNRYIHSDTHIELAWSPYLCMMENLSSQFACHNFLHRIIFSYLDKFYHTLIEMVKLEIYMSSTEDKENESF